MPKISLSGPAELLVTVPFHLGFTPRSSVVVVCFHGKRLGMMARVDATGRADAAAAAANLVPALERERPTAVAILGFEDRAGETMASSDALAVAVALARIPVRERLVVRDGRWYGIGCECCPAEGTPLPEPADVAAVATFVGLGRAVLGTRDEMARLVEPLAPDARRHDLIASAVLAWQERYHQAVTNELLRALAPLEHDEPDVWPGGGSAGWGDELGDADEPWSPSFAGFAVEEVWLDDDDDDDEDDDDTAEHEAWLDVDDDDEDDDEDEDEAGTEHGNELAWGQPEDDATDTDPTPWEFLVDEALVAWGALLRGDLQGPAVEHWMAALVGCLRDRDLRDALIAWICPGTLSMDQVNPVLLDRLALHLGDELRLDDQSPDGEGDAAGSSDERPRTDGRAARGEASTVGDRTPDGTTTDAGGRAAERTRRAEREAADWAAAMAPKAIESRLEQLCRLTPAAHAAPVLSVYASFAWWSGDGAKAGMAVDRALELEPDHRLCGLIRTALDHGLRSRPAA